jgi:oligoendopeptidase F
MSKGDNKYLGGYMKKKLLNLALVLALSVSLIAPSNVYANTGKDNSTVKATTATPTPTAAPAAKDEIEHGNTAFSDITYVRPDFKGMQAIIKSVIPLLNKKNQAKKIDKLCAQLDDAIYDAYTMKTYLDIQTSHDVTDQKTADEASYVGSKISSIYRSYSKLCIRILESQYGYILRNELTQAEIDDIYKTNEQLTPEVIKLEAKADDLIAKYLKALNTTTVKVNGVDMTENDLTNSTVLTQDEKNSYYSKLLETLNQTTGSIYLDLTKVYKDIATAYGFKNVTDYMYDSYDRDYSAKQTQAFSTYVKKYIVPLYIDLASTWTQEEVDLVLSADGELSRLEPYFKDYFIEVSNDMNEAYEYMKKLGLYSMDATPVKQNLNYTTYLYGLEEPYLSLYTTGYYTDVTSYIHEFGHYSAFYLNGSDLGSNIDICEIHSQANELLFLPYYKVFGDAYKPITKNQILQSLGVIIDGCIYDEFQQYVYSNNLTTVKELNEAFFNIRCEYGLEDPNSGYTQDLSWVYVSHTFETPFYYISYAMSAIPSLEIFTDSLTDRAAAIDTYNEVVNYGTDYSFLKLLKKVNLDSPFKEATYSSLVEALYKYFGLTYEEAKPAA